MSYEDKWFRFYNDVINDPKVQLLPKALRWAWVELLCLASKNDGVLPSIEHIAFSVRASVNDAQADVDALILAGLIDIGPDGKLRPHNWEGRQFQSDTSRERTRKWRERKKSASRDVTGDSGDVTGDGIDPDPESESDLDPPYPPVSAEGSKGFQIALGRVGSVSVEARRRVCAKLAIGNADPLVALFDAWPSSCRARDPDALFLSVVEQFYRDAAPEVRQACQPLGVAPDLPSMPAARPSAALIAKLAREARHGVRAH